MSKTFTLFTLISDIQSQVIADARLEYIRLRVRIRDRSAGDWKCLSVNPAVNGCLSSVGKRKE